mmetsp:Transcript_53530/g.142260  ORF Transcript_53530/g.142260 Transcript_53530/m.142260 type:complete len:549 (-) Transcript_53530:995-2641(-)
MLLPGQLATSLGPPRPPHDLVSPVHAPKHCLGVVAMGPRAGHQIPGRRGALQRFRGAYSVQRSVGRFRIQLEAILDPGQACIHEVPQLGADHIASGKVRRASLGVLHGLSDHGMQRQPAHIAAPRRFRVQHGEAGEELPGPAGGVQHGAVLGAEALLHLIALIVQIDLLKIHRHFRNKDGLTVLGDVLLQLMQHVQRHPLHAHVLIEVHASDVHDDHPGRPGWIIAQRLHHAVLDLLHPLEGILEESAGGDVTFDGVHSELFPGREVPLARRLVRPGHEHVVVVELLAVVRAGLRRVRVRDVDGQAHAVPRVDTGGDQCHGGVLWPRCCALQIPRGRPPGLGHVWQGVHVVIRRGKACCHTRIEHRLGVRAPGAHQKQAVGSDLRVARGLVHVTRFSALGLRDWSGADVVLDKHTLIHGFHGLLAGYIALEGALCIVLENARWIVHANCRALLNLGLCRLVLTLEDAIGFDVVRRRSALTDRSPVLEAALPGPWRTALVPPFRLGLRIHRLHLELPSGQHPGISDTLEAVAEEEPLAASRANLRAFPY